VNLWTDAINQDYMEERRKGGGEGRFKKKTEKKEILIREQSYQLGYWA